MPLLKSPAQILKVWKRATSDYLDLLERTSFPKDEEENWNNKAVKALERLRKLAKNLGMGNKVNALVFGETRNDCLTPLQKVRKLFKPRKSQTKVKKFYLTLCRIILILEQLLCEELVDDDSEPSTSALNDVDGEALDRREEPTAGGDTADPEAPAPPAPKAPRPAAPPNPDALRFAERFKALSTEVAAQPAGPSRTIDLERRLAEAQVFGRNNDYAQANARLDQLEALLRQRAAVNGAPRAEADLAAAFEKRLKTLLSSALEAQKRDPAGAAALKQKVDAALASSVIKDYVRGNTALDQLEQLLRQAAAAKVVLNGGATESSRLQERLKNLLPAVLAARGANHPQAGAMRALVSEANLFGSKRDFGPAHAALDQVEALLKQPANAPAAKPTAGAAAAVWRDARDTVNDQLNKLRSALLGTPHPLFRQIAELGLNGLTKRLNVNLQAILFEFDSARGEQKAKAATRLRALATQYQTLLDTEPGVRLVDENPFGVQVTVRATLGKALQQLLKISEPQSVPVGV